MTLLSLYLYFNAKSDLLKYRNGSIAVVLQLLTVFRHRMAKYSCLYDLFIHKQMLH